MFYFGAAIHLVQDMTIPQHANIRLLDNHKQYETFVKRTYSYLKEFLAQKGSILFDTINEYIRFNARVAMKVYRKFKVIRENEQRYYRTTRCVLPLAERTTAGCMVMFYKDIMAESHGIKH
jgi:phospholipase C